VQCEGHVFICNDCDAKGGASFGDHFATHDLVRCQELVEDGEISMEDRLTSLEERFEKHEVTMNDRLGQLESKVDGRLSRVDDRLSRVETLLEAVLAKMGVAPV